MERKFEAKLSSHPNAERLRAMLERPIPLTDSRERNRALVDRSRALTTAVYLDSGFIDAEHLDRDGLYVDKYSSRATYFFAETPSMHATTRMIHSKHESAIDSLPTGEHFEIDYEKLAGVARVGDANELDGNIVEISSLAALPKKYRETDTDNGVEITKVLYAQMLRESLDQNHRVWLLNTHQSLLRHLSTLLGRDQVHVIGTPREYLGSITIPAAINPSLVVESVMKDNSLIGEMKREYLV
ncbi:hypothetical protein B7Z17_01020, partial [Candidatus Saccharibacteria bacterium 32-49-10]